MDRILLIDDEEDFRLYVKAALANGPYELRLASSVSQASDQLSRCQFSLILLDIHLKDGDGLDFFIRLKERNPAIADSVIFLSARSEVTDKVKGLALGANDYLTKPIDRLELRARIESKLRLLHQHLARQDLVEIGPFRISQARQRAFAVGPDGSEADLALSPAEFRILSFLARREGAVMSRETLLNEVWGENIALLDRVVDKHVSALRKKLGSLAFHVETVPRMGYRFSLSPARRRAA